MTETQVKPKVQSNIDVDEFPRFYVIMHNDDKTSFDFVVDILQSIFKHDQHLAVDLTMKIHDEGNAIVGMYNLEIAEQKVEDATQLARSNGFPLTLTIEQA